MANDVQSDGYSGPANETTSAEEFNALSFLIGQVLSGKWTITLALVKSVTGGGVSTPPTVSVQPMVNQVDGDGNPTPHGIINNVPVFRLQGGSNAFIADPVAGDIGLIACATRDISAVKNNLAPSNPGSQRTFDPADALYLGGFLNPKPGQYIQITTDGINIVLSEAVSIKVMSSSITLAVGATSIVVEDGTITIGGIVWGTHMHPVTTAPGTSGPPIA